MTIKKLNISQDNKRKSQDAVLKASAVVGSQSELSRSLGCCAANVSLWANGVQIIPISRAIECERITKGVVKASQLRPDFF